MFGRALPCLEGDAQVILKLMEALFSCLESSATTVKWTGNMELPRTGRSAASHWSRSISASCTFINPFNCSGMTRGNTVWNHCVALREPVMPRGALHQGFAPAPPARPEQKSLTAQRTHKQGKVRLRGLWLLAAKACLLLSRY